MTHTMAGADELWALLHQPVQDLKENRATEPDTEWPARREFFVTALARHLSTDHPAVAALLGYLDSLTDDDRAEVIGTDALDAAAYEIATQHGQPVFDDAAWQRFLAEHLAHWNGTDEHWPAIRDWVREQALAHQFDAPAEQLIGYVDPMSAPERIAVFAEYGVTVEPPVTRTAAEPTPDPALDDEGEAVMADVLTANPEFADIPEERRRQLVAEVLREENGS